MRATPYRAMALALAASFALVFFGQASADGEAGLVVQDGDVVRTYCIAFTGDGITGQQMLQQAGLSVGAYGGGSGLAVCSIGQRGCSDASSFSTCWCECQGGDCVYWAFFTRQYGRNWVYSSLAFNLLKAKDGDVHGWKWGQGGPNSAPAPVDVTFDQICGHAPRDGAAVTQPPATLAPATQLPPTPTTAQGTTAATEASGSTVTAPAQSPSAAPTVSVTITREATVTAATATGVPSFQLPPDSGGEEDGGGSKLGIIAFAVIAAGMVAAIGGAAVWRSRRGS